MSRKPIMRTPNILDDVLVPTIVEDRGELRRRLHFDYDAIDADNRRAVQDAAVDILASGVRIQESVAAIGRRLLEVKALLPHGQWEEWLHVEFALSAQSARRMIQVAQNLDLKALKLSGLQPSVLYLLAADSTPDAARQAVSEAAAGGMRMSVAEARRIIAEHKQAQATADRDYGDEEEGLVIDIVPEASHRAAAQVPDGREALLEDFAAQMTEMLDGLTLWGQATGRHTETGEAERGLRRLLAITQRELALLRGEDVEREAWLPDGADTG
ncbi:MAG: DUF3102 domain-containing protein [Caldilinea sp.]|nr:DUF3102 domain-containing protein [Caldilinea sp.]